MHLGKFHYSINLIDDEFSVYKIEEKLSELLSALQNSVSTPNEENTEAFREKYTELSKILRSCKTNDVTPTQRMIFDEIGASQYIGIGLCENINRIISENNITPSNALIEITKLNENVKEFHNKVEPLNSIFTELKIEYTDLEPSEAEIGIVIPKELVDSNLDGLEKEMHEFNYVFKTFKEVVGEKLESIKIRTISSSDFELFLESTPVLAALIATTIERIVALYKNLLEIKQLRANLVKQKVPKKHVKPIEQYEKDVIEKGLEDIAKSLINDNYKGDSGRKNELRNALNAALRSVANRIEKGVIIEVRVAEPEDPEKAEDLEEGKKPNRRELANYKKLKELTERINQQGRSITQLKRGDKLIPLLSTEKPKDNK